VAKTYTPRLKKILRRYGCRFERQGKGDHEIWYSPTFLPFTGGASRPVQGRGSTPTAHQADTRVR
jgi:hypothetical protein